MAAVSFRGLWERGVVLQIAVCFQSTDTSKFFVVYSQFWIKLRSLFIAGLHPQSPRHFAWQPSTRVSQTLWPTNMSHYCSCYLTGEYLHLHRCFCRNTLIFAHSPDFVWHQHRHTLPATEAWDCGITPNIARVGSVINFRIKHHWT